MKTDMQQPRLLDVPPVAGPTNGKTLAALYQSRADREEIIRFFNGIIPMSIMVHNRDPHENDPAHGTYEESGYKSDDPVLDKVFKKSGQGAANGALSTFPQEIGGVIVKIYSEPGASVIDPFAGHNSRMELVSMLGRSYTGIDLSQKFMKFNISERLKLLEKGASPITLYTGDSREVLKTLPDNAYDFTITSPPYYDIEYYGDEPQQLGKLSTYRKFLDAMGEVIQENFRVLKHGAYCVYFVNDFRREGKFRVYHADTIRLLEKAGFEIQDMLIVDLGYPIRASFLSQVIEQRILPKKHEYGLIAQKTRNYYGKAPK